MANNALINVAGEVAQSQGFVDVGQEFQDSVMKWLPYAEKRIQERKDKKDAADARANDYMEKIPTGKGLAKVPYYMQEKVGSWLNEQRRSYAEHANALRELEPGDEVYQSHVNAMNDITNAFTNLDDQLTRLLENKADYLEGVEMNNISYGNKGDDIDFLSHVFTDSTDVNLDVTGQLVFGKEGQTRTLDELPEWIEVNSTIPAALTTLNAKYYQVGEEISGPLEANLRMQVKQLVKSEGKHGVLSLAADSPLTGDERGLAIPEELLHDPARYDELIDSITNSWVEAIKESASIGKQQKRADWDRKHPKKPVVPKNSLDKYFLEEK